MPQPSMSEEQYWAWYAKATGRETSFKAEEKVEAEATPKSTSSACQTTSAVQQLKATPSYEQALAIANKMNAASLPFLSAVDVLLNLAVKHRWRTSQKSYQVKGGGAVSHLSNKIAVGIATPKKVETKVVCHAVYALAKFDQLETNLIKNLQKYAEANWDPKAIQSDASVHFIWAAAKAGVKLDHEFYIKFIDSIKEGIKALSYGEMAEATWAVQKNSISAEGGVRRTPNEDALFAAIAKRSMAEQDHMDPEPLVDIIHNHASLGLTNEALLKSICPKLLQAKLNEALLEKCIAAYTRFSVPFRDPSQGYRQTAIVVKGDYQRPSDKPPKKKQKYTKPMDMLRD